MREFFHQGELVGADFAGDGIAHEPFLRKKVFQKRAYFLGEAPLDDRGKLLTPRTSPVCRILLGSKS